MAGRAFVKGASVGRDRLGSGHCAPLCRKQRRRDHEPKSGGLRAQ